MKEVLIADIECYVNYFLLAFRNVKTGNARAFEMFDGQPLDIQTIKEILNRYQIITFNGLNFDFPILTLALAGANNAKLKECCDAIISGGLKSWDIESRFGIKIPQNIDHIDIFHVTPGQLKVSLKMYAGRLHSPKMQDLPIDPSALITPAQREELKTYCFNDLRNTQLLYEHLKPQIELREKMSKEYGMDLRSKSDAQIAEAVIVHQCKKLLGKDIYRPQVMVGSQFKYKAPAFVRFQTEVLQDTLEMIEETNFVIDKNGNVQMPGTLADYKIKIGEGVYRMGIGGLHSSEESVRYVSGDEMIVDVDATSFYPATILNNSLYPAHIGPEFLVVYRSIVERRIQAKRDKDNDVAASLKIVILSSFGKFGSKWSKLYSPTLMIQTTLTGQLSLLMCIEDLDIHGIEVVSANTDGITVKFPKEKENVFKEVIKNWEMKTAYNMEFVEFSSCNFQHVNSYIHLLKNGEVKRKGPLGELELDKNPTNEICVEAVINLLTKGVPVEQTIRNSKDVTGFVSIRNVKGGAIHDNVPLGRVARWIYSKDSRGPITYKTNGNKVAKTDGCRPLMDLPETFPADIDYDWYIREAHSILNDIGYYKEKYI